MPELTLDNVHEEMQKTFGAFKEEREKIEENIAKYNEILGDTKGKVERIEADLNKQEDLLQKAALAEEAKNNVAKAQEEIEELKGEIKKMKRPDMNGSNEESEEEKARKSAAETYIRFGDGRLTQEMAKTITLNDPDSGGLFELPPTLMPGILRDLGSISPLRGMAHVIPNSSRSLSWIKKNVLGNYGWAGETQTRDKSTEPNFKVITIGACEIHAIAYVSRQALTFTSVSLEDLILDDVREGFAIGEGGAFLNGDGEEGKPQGIMNEPDIEFIKSGGASALTADSIIDLRGALKAGHDTSAQFLMNRKTRTYIRKLKGTDGQYIWMPALEKGESPTLDGKPYKIDDNMPDIAANAFPILYGDFYKGYKINDVNKMTVSRDESRKREKGIVEIWVYRYVGGAVVLPEAIKKLKIAA